MNKKVEKLPKNKWCSGSMTIEMAYMMPVLILILTLFIYLWFYLYNNYLLEETIERTLINWEKEWELSNEELEEQMKEQMEKELASGLLAVETYEVTTKASFATLEAEGSYKMYVSLAGFLGGIAGKDAFSHTYHSSIRRENPVSLVRTYRTIEALMEGVKLDVTTEL